MVSESDVDFIAVVAPDHEAAFGDAWRAALETVRPLVFWTNLNLRRPVFNAITDEWQRIDVVVTTEVLLKARGKDSVRPLIDRLGLYEILPNTEVWAGPDRGVVVNVIKEFLRVLGLLSVIIGRKEYLVGVAGTGLLLNLLFTLLSKEVEKADKGGMLAWRRRFVPEQLDVLARLPIVEPTRASIIAGHLAYAIAFLPRARGMAASV